MYRVVYLKPDGRRLLLYSRKPISGINPERIFAPGADAATAQTEMRWHPLRQEWVIYASHRQDRTFLPRPENNPLAPSDDPTRPTELPVGDYEVAVFENRFPTLVPAASTPSNTPGTLSKPGVGRCEVVVFSQDPQLSLWQLPVEQIELILEIWADRTRDMASDNIKYVLPFENRGPEMGVTLHHPHGQIYGYSFVPAEIARTVEALRRCSDNGSDFVSSLAQQERALSIRTVATAQSALAFVPPFARFPYETWVVPFRPAADLTTLTAQERHDVAALLGEALQRLDALWNVRMPYLLSVNQAPMDGVPHPEWTLRIEVWPIRRAPEKLKYLAGTELAAGVFASDVMPEEAARQLRTVVL